MRRLVSRWWWTPLALLALVAAGALVWALTPYPPMPEALAALELDGDDELARSTTGGRVVFAPGSGTPAVGLIIYPGARVDPRAYAPLARGLASAGVLAVIVRMPLNLAVLDAGAAARVMTEYPGTRRWVVAGHSLGGAMAARFAHANPGSVSGLALWAAYPAGSDDLSGRDLDVVSVSGSADGLATPEKIAASRRLLPPATRFVEIHGGNHAQFGWYGDQPGDRPAALSRQDQQLQVFFATLDLLLRVEGRGP